MNIKLQSARNMQGNPTIPIYTHHHHAQVMVSMGAVQVVSHVLTGRGSLNIVGDGPAVLPGCNPAAVSG